MATIAEQVRAEIARRKQQGEKEAAIQAQPGPTLAKGELERSARIEGIKRAILAAEAQRKEDTSVLGTVSNWLSPSPASQHGATFGADIPASGAAAAFIPAVSGIGPEVSSWFTGEDNPYWSNVGEHFAGGEAARRAQLQISEAETIAPKTQEFLSSLASGGVANAGRNFLAELAGRRVLPAAQKGFLRTAAEAGGVGAGTGFVHGASTSPGDLKDRLVHGGVEGLIGGTAGTLLGTASRALQPETGPATARVAAADEFGIPLTRGQATGNVAQQTREQELLHGAKGPAGQAPMLQHQQRVDTAMGGARENIRDRFAPYRGGDQQQSGQLLTESLRRRAERLRTVGGGRIEEALTSGAEVDASHLLDLPARLETRLAGPNAQVPEHYIGVNTPVAAEAMQRVRDFIRTVPDDPSARISLAGVNQLRRNLLSLSGQSDLDNRALSAIKNEVDNWIDDIAGADPALAQLRHGNELYRRGSEIVNPRGRDVTQADRNVARLAGEEATGEDAVRIFKVGQQGQVGAETARTARAISERFGANSPQMQRVRDIAAVSLLDGGPQRVATQIDNFLTRNRSAAEAMFTPEQIAELGRFRDVSRNMIPDPRATNPPKSGYGPMKTVLRNTLLGGGALLGAKFGGGDLGLVASTLVGGAAGRGAEAALGSRAANKALQPIPGGQSLTSTATKTGQVTPELFERMPDRATLARLMGKAGL